MSSQNLNSNYKLINSKTVTEINSDVLIYEHIKTGARLMYIKNDDNNKAFSIAFKTPPEDDTGCPHILEHSVLNGSKNYPGKNTFTELMKGSMKTFLNAMTGSDRTMYPFASTNEQDYFNLMEVYLDAVFYPQIYTNPDILKQEGWHYELFKPEDEVIYKGVVYNEMKGAFSSPESVLFRKIEQIQFPDTPYHFESGGDPKNIPELTWDKFKAFHKRFYHPSNSWIYLYGNLDIDKALSFIDNKFLSAFEKNLPDNDIPLQKPFIQAIKVEEQYSIGEDDSPEGKNYLSLNFTCAPVLDITTTAALSTLKQILMDSAASPLKLAIQNSNLSADNFASFDDSCLQPTFTIVCKHVKTEDIEALSNLIYNELKEIAGKGIDKKLIEATINSKEFALREAEMGHFPKGLYYHWVSLRNWIHGGDPISNIEFEPIIAELRKALTQPVFEQLIEKYLLNNLHSSQVILKPVKGLVKENDEQTRKILAEYKTTLTPAQIKDLIEENIRLQEWQSTPDSQEDIAKIPFISLKDIKREAEKLPIEAEKHDLITLLKHPVATNGIVYLSAYFDINHLTEEDLQWVSLYSDLLGNLDSENYPFSELANEIDIHTGGISTELSVYPDTKVLDKLMPKLVMRCKCILTKTDKMLELASEYTFKTKFEDTSRILKLVKEAKARTQMMIINSGHLTAIRRMLAQQSQSHMWQDMTQGMDYYKFLSNVEATLSANPQEITDKLTKISQTIFNQKELLISITSLEEDIRQVWQKIPIFTKHIRNVDYQIPDKIFKPVKNNEGIIAPVNIQYCAQGGSFSQFGHKYSGNLMVLTNILRNEFLMQELRVKGGAYGILVNFSRQGHMFFCSYRDPNLVNTLEVYSKTADYVKNFECSKRDFEKYIIGTMAELDMPYSPFQKGINSDSHYITGFTEDDRQNLRDEVLNTIIEDIRKYSSLIDDVMKKHQIAVFGVETTLKDNRDLFDVLIPAIPN